MGDPGKGCWKVRLCFPVFDNRYSHSTVSSVSSSSGLGGLVDDNVLDDQLLNREVLGVGVGLGVFEQSKHELNRLDGPSTYKSVQCYIRPPTFCGLELLGLRSSSNTTSKSSERNDLLVLLNIGKVGVGLLQVHS